jgi:hypothetical protein
MGELYRAPGYKAKRIALKIIPEHLSSNPETRGRFQREAHAIGR